MDYSPTPNKVKPQYAFLDDSLEMGRSYKGSPLKHQYQSQKDTETFHQKQKQFYNKYTDLGTPDILKDKQKARSGGAVSNTDTTSRLFKNIGNKVPVDDVVKINSNMIEKIIRDNESLKADLKEERRENQILNGFANGLKEKLVKYKRLNDELKSRNEELKKDNDKLIQRQEEVIDKKADATLPESPKYNFDPDNVQDIFENNNKDEDVKAEDVVPAATIVASSKIDERITSLENEVSKINSSQDDKFEYIKNEIEFLKNLSLQVKPKDEVNKKEMDENKSEEKEEKEKEKETGGHLPKEDDLIVKESLELKELQELVDNVTRKLQLREENKLKKYALQKELERLAEQLQHDDIPSSLSHSINSNKIQTSEAQSHHNIQEVHTPEAQTSPSSSMKIQQQKTKQQEPTNNLHKVEERFDMKCNVCGPKTPVKTPVKTSTPLTSSASANSTGKHIPSFKIGDTIWH